MKVFRSLCLQSPAKQKPSLPMYTNARELLPGHNDTVSLNSLIHHHCQAIASVHYHQSMLGWQWHQQFYRWGATTFIEESLRHCHTIRHPTSLLQVFCKVLTTFPFRGLLWGFKGIWPLTTCCSDHQRFMGRPVSDSRFSQTAHSVLSCRQPTHIG